LASPDEANHHRVAGRAAAGDRIRHTLAPDGGLRGSAPRSVASASAAPT